ncbi:MAG TPA: SpoIIE family protein phosphatase [Rudaea sp.]|jgi:serine phosphatase RsbU (regulator of sigma subunit)/pSer/pThr/pTyr-binding forkhead associated (FHA) protein|nr:SpoIIE family protein phosphatase [Rudaea sp.]
MPSLVVTSGALTGQIFSFSDSAVIGRGQFSEVRLNDPTVSRRHALIRSVGTGYEVSDQDSANGTRYRGVRIAEPVLVHDGDELEFGEIKTVFRSTVAVSGETDVAQSGSDPATASQPTFATHNADAVQLRATPAPAAPAPPVAPGLRELIARLKLFCDIGALARREEPMRDQLGRALDALLGAFPLTRCAAVFASDAASEYLAPIARRDRGEAPADLPHAEAFLREVVRQENGMAIVDAAARDALAMRLQVSTLPAALLGVPLRIGSEVLGALYLDSADHAHAWRAADQELFLGVAGQLAWLIATQRGRSSERAIESHDLALARRIQQRFLPQVAPTIGGYQIAESYSAARVIGGDYFDFFNYRDGRAGIVIADVSGKSVSGALYMARLSVQVRALARHMSGPHELLAGLNRRLYQELEPGMFVTMLAAALEPEAGTLEFSCAGHPPPLVRGADGRVTELAAPGALPLGAMNDVQFGQHSVTLAPGSCVLLYTDGLDEAHNEKQELFGKERVMEALARSGNAQDVLDSMLVDLARFTAGEAQSDDLTLIVMSRNR